MLYFNISKLNRKFEKITILDTHYAVWCRTLCYLHTENCSLLNKEESYKNFTKEVILWI